jgi:hypothetical protein
MFLDIHTQSLADLTIKVDLPMPPLGARNGEAFPRSKRPHPMTSGRKVGAAPRPRTPVRTHHFRHSSLHHPVTPPTTAPLPSSTSQVHAGQARPILQRAHSSALAQSFSTGMIGPVPKFARQWGRTAHLHEVKVVKSEGGRTNGPKETPLKQGDIQEDVFGPGPSTSEPLASAGKEARVLDVDAASEGDGWVDTDAELEP